MDGYPSYLRQATLNEIWLSEIPAHWEAIKIKYLFDERSEKGHPDEPLLAATQNMGVVPKNVYGQRTVEATKDLHLLKLVRKDDFVISLRSFQGGIERAYYQGIISPAYTIMIPKGISVQYFKHLAKSKVFIDLLQQCVTGVREGQNIDYSMLRDIRIPVPPIEENGFDFATEVLNITVFSLYEGNQVAYAKVKNLIDFTCDAEQCLLSKGIWYQYNDDYLEYLRASIAEIQTEYNPAYDFSEAMHAAFIEVQLPEARALPENRGKDDDTLRKGLKKKYYAERAYNLLMERDHGFVNYDRNDQKVGDAKVEKMDLYKNNTMFAVKIGNTSGKLCYAVDQSLTSLKLYKRHLLENMPLVKAIAIWLVLERDEHIEDANGKPVIDALNMLMLKNRLDQWKKEVRVQGFTPIIYINYRHN